MDILSYIQRDHRKVAQMMERLTDVNLFYVRMTTFNELRAELELHAAAEAMTFYGALKAEAGEGDLRQRLAEAEQNQAEIGNLLEILGTIPVSSDVWMETFGDLKRSVEQHVLAEETIVFPRARVVFSPARLRQLSRDMDKAKFMLRNEIQMTVQ